MAATPIARSAPSLLYYKATFQFDPISASLIDETVPRMRGREWEGAGTPTGRPGPPPMG